MKQRILILIVAMALCGLAKANPNITTFDLRKVDRTWLVETSVSRGDMHKALTKYYPTRNHDPVFVNEYKSHVSSYMLSHLTVLGSEGVNASPVNCEVKLGHEVVKLSMKLTEDDLDFSEFIVSLNFLSELEGHQNRLVVHEGGSKQALLLTTDNNYTLIGSIEQEESMIFLGLTIGIWLMILVPLVLIVFLMTYGFNMYENYVLRKSEYEGQF